MCCSSQSFSSFSNCFFTVIIEPDDINPNQYTWGPRGPRHTFCEIFYDLFVIFLPNFMYSSPIHMSSWRQSITYLGLAQKPAHTILHWGPRGPQTNQF